MTGFLYLKWCVEQVFTRNNCAVYTMYIHILDTVQYSTQYTAVYRFKTVAYRTVIIIIIIII